MITSTQPQGDVYCHVKVKVDAAYAGLLNSANHGELVTEVIPNHRVAIPKPGSRVSVTGSWVRDVPKEPYELTVTVKLDDEAGAAGLIFGGDGGDKHYGFYPSGGKLRLTRFDGPNVFTWKVLFDQKIDAIHELASQHYEGGANGSEEQVRSVPPASDVAGRKDWLRRTWLGRAGGEANRYRAELMSFYGDEKGKAVKYAECFEICEYGRQPDRAELKKLFPFFD